MSAKKNEKCCMKFLISITMFTNLLLKPLVKMLNKLRYAYTYRLAKRKKNRNYFFTLLLKVTFIKYDWAFTKVNLTILYANDKGAARLRGYKKNHAQLN